MLTIELKPNSKKVLELTVKYGDEQVVIENPQGTRKPTVVEGVEDFDGFYRLINKYLSEIPEEDQRRLFVLIKRANRRTNKARESSTGYMLDLKDTVRRAISNFNYPRFREWFRSNCEGLQIDPEMETVFIEDVDSSKTRSKTYLVSDYIDLISLVLTFRALFPVYSDYLTYSLEVDEHPYYRIYNLFLGSQLDADDEDPLGKLRLFISENNDTLNDGKDREILVITAGLSDEDEVDNLLSSCLFMKVLWHDFFLNDTRIVSTFYNHVRFPPLNKKRGGSSDKQLRFRSSKPSGGDDDDYGYFERMLRTAEISLGDTVTLQESLKDDRLNLAGLGYDPDEFDVDFYRNELKNIGVFMERPVEPMLLYLLSWFYSRIVSPDAFFCIEDRRVFELMFMAKTLLYSSGNPDQMYMGTVLSSLIDEETSFLNPTVVVKGSLGKELSAKLEKLFPFAIDDGGITHEVDIIEISKAITNLTWRPQGYNDPRFVNAEGYLLTPKNINDVVVAYVELVINLGPK